MENETNSPIKTRSNKWIWIIVGIVVLGAAAACCILLVIGVFLFQTDWSHKTIIPQPQIVPPLQTSPAVPSVTAESPFGGLLSSLDYQADPLYGSASLQRGLSPDPLIVAAGAGGALDTSTLDLNLDCGFTTSAPTFAFSLSGGAEEGFLRIFYATSDNTDTTLVVHTPDQEWICMDDSSYGNGIDPVVDFDYAASGDYAVWVGTHQSDTYGTGSLYITESANTTP